MRKTLAHHIIFLAALCLAGCSSNLSEPGSFDRLGALMDWNTPDDLGRAFYDDRYYVEDPPLRRLAADLKRVRPAEPTVSR